MKTAYKNNHEPGKWVCASRIVYKKNTFIFLKLVIKTIKIKIKTIKTNYTAIAKIHTKPSSLKGRGNRNSVLSPSTSHSPPPPAHSAPHPENATSLPNQIHFKLGASYMYRAISDIAFRKASETWPVTKQQRRVVVIPACVLFLRQRLQRPQWGNYINRDCLQSDDYSTLNKPHDDVQNTHAG